MSAGRLSDEELLCLASLLLGDAARGPDRDSGMDGFVAADVERSARGRQSCSSAAYVRAVRAWAQGGTLAEAQEQGLPVGHLCRHLLRVSDAVRELVQAFHRLGASLDARRALELLERGLPFAYRCGAD